MTIKFGVLALIFAVLKWNDVIDWSWWWLLPIAILNVCWLIIKIIKSAIRWAEK